VVSETPDAQDRPITVLIVEDHAVLAQGLAIVLQQLGHTVVMTDGARGSEAIEEQAAALSPEVVLLDLHLEGTVGDTVALIGPLRTSGAEVIVLTGDDNPAHLGACVEAGASAIAAKTQPLEEIIETVQRAARHEVVLSPGYRQQLLDALHDDRAQERERLAPFDTLSAREQEVLGALTKGMSADAAADAFYVSVATVRSQIRSILQKLGVASQLQAVALARQAGWTPDSSRTRD
jgi:DNA-binding NarL/FixJ family response regulator